MTKEYILTAVGYLICAKLEEEKSNNQAHDDGLTHGSLDGTGVTGYVKPSTLQQHESLLNPWQVPGQFLWADQECREWVNG